MKIRHTLLVLILCIVLFIPNCSAAWLPNWNCSSHVLVDNDAQNLSDYQINLILQGNDPTAPNYIDFDRVLPDGTDLKITGSDAITPIPFWIEKWNDTSKTASIWTNISTVTKSPLPAYFKFSTSDVAHNTYGLSYPVTYIFEIPADSVGLTAYTQYTQNDVWTQLTEKTSSDYFNGIDAVRFDYLNNTAYVSAAFGSESNNLYIKIIDSESNQVGTYIKTAKYYDNRQAVVTATCDDSVGLDSNFSSIAEMFSDRNMWLTAGITTKNGGINMTPAAWADLQSTVDLGYIEPASHSRTHQTVPYIDYDSEIGGSKSDIIDNLVFPTLNSKGDDEYLYLWIEPGGSSDSTARKKLGEYDYLCDRSVLRNANYYARFDDGNDLYNRSGVTLELDDPSLVSYATTFTSVNAWNATFDSVIDTGGIYTMYFHPPGIVQSNLEAHLDHIKNNPSLWYTGYGNLYLYAYTRQLASARMPTSGQDVYIYYGNPSAEPSASYDTTFTKLSVPSNLVGYWYMDEADDTILHDYAGTDDGTISGAVHAPDTMSLWSTGSLLSFDGINDGVDLGNYVSSQFTTKFSIGATVRYMGESTPAMCAIVNKGKMEWSAPYNGYYLGYSPSTTRWEFKVADADTSYDIVAYSQSYADVYNTTHEIFATFDNGLMTLYVDGVPVSAKRSTSVTNVSATLSNLKIGVYSTGMGSKYWGGQIDNVMTYDCTLTEDEINTIIENRKYARSETAVATSEFRNSKNIIYNHTVNTIMPNAEYVSYLSYPDEVDRINAVEIVPSDIININISSWNTTGKYDKTWVESSLNPNTTTSHIIGDFPATASIIINRDGVAYSNVVSNSSGYINWMYSGGYSEHIFTAELSPADFTGSQTSGNGPLTIKYTDHALNDPTAWYWDFENDGVIDSTKQNPVHTYGKAGNYTVNLTVQNEYGNFSTVKTDYITVSSPAFSSDPVAWFNYVFSYLHSVYVGLWVTA